MTNLSKKSFSILCAVLMTVMIFQNVSAEDEFITGEDMDIFIDSFGNEHQVWRELVNGTYQVFYGYQIADNIYNTNSASYVNQTINTNINFDDGFLTIQNCTLIGNIMITRGNVILQDCNISGNVKIDLGRIKIINCDIIGNLETKNADLEMRYSELNGNINAKQSSYDDLSEIIINNDINGNVKIKSGICFILGNIIIGNLDVNDPAIIQQVLDNDVKGIVKLNENTDGFIGYQVTNSTYNTTYPQCAVDQTTGIGYILWIDRSMNLYCMGTQDYIEWSMPKNIGTMLITSENPELNFGVQNGLLVVTWKDGGFLSLFSDLDNDLILDTNDSEPILYNSGLDEIFTPDVVSINNVLGVSIAIDYEGDSRIPPLITSASPPNAIPGGASGVYINISTESNESFTAMIKISYNPNSLPLGLEEKYLCLYRWNNIYWEVCYEYRGVEDTGVDRSNNYVWGWTKHFSTYTYADALLNDEDEGIGDGISDGEEMNLDNAPYTSVNLLADNSASETLVFDDFVNQRTVELNIPDYVAASEYVVDAKLVLKGTSQLKKLYADRFDYNVGQSIFDQKAADFDNDGDDDLILNKIGGYLSYYENIGNGTFMAPVEYTSIEGGYHLCTADFDKDGDIDIAMSLTNAGRFALFFNNGTFSQGVIQAPADSSDTLMINDLDFDGDSDIDIACVRFSVSQGIHLDIFANNGSGSFSLSTSYYIGQYNLLYAEIESWDFDGDSDEDIIISDPGSNFLRYLENNGNGSFSQPIAYDIGIPLTYICAADIDNDGDLDIGAATSYIPLEGTCTSYFYVISNGGNGNFTVNRRYETFTDPHDICAADFDNDNDIDFAIPRTNWAYGCEREGVLSVFANNDDGTFAESIDFVANNSAPIISASDFDNDLDIDVLISNNGSGTFSYFENTGQFSLNASLDVGDDGIIEWSDEINSANSITTPNFVTAINENILSHSDANDDLIDNNITIPLVFHSDTPGKIEIEYINILVGVFDTDPSSLDTDKDGLNDGLEFNIGLSRPQTINTLEKDGVNESEIVLEFTGGEDKILFANIPVTNNSLEYVKEATMKLDTQEFSANFDENSNNFNAEINQIYSDIWWDSEKGTVRYHSDRRDSGDEMFTRNLGMEITEDFPEWELSATTMITSRYPTGGVSYPLFISDSERAQVNGSNCIQFYWHHESGNSYSSFSAQYYDASGNPRINFTVKYIVLVEFHLKVAYKEGTLSMYIMDENDNALGSGSYLIGSNVGDGFTLGKIGVASRGTNHPTTSWVNGWTDDISLSFLDRTLLTLEAGNDSEFQFIDKGVDTTNVLDFSSEINQYISIHEDGDNGAIDGNVSVPITIHSEIPGQIKISNISIFVDILTTNPARSDTDGDGLGDGEELNIAGMRGGQISTMDFAGFESEITEMTFHQQKNHTVNINIPVNSSALEYVTNAKMDLNWVRETTEIYGGSQTNQFYPNSIVDPDGNIHLVWQDNTDILNSGPDFDIFYKVCKNGNWSEIQLISSESNGNSYTPKIAINSTGFIYIVWADMSDYDGSGGDGDLFYKYWSGVTWSLTEVIPDTSFNVANYAWTSLNLQFDKNDNLHLVWADCQDEVYQIEHKILSNGIWNYTVHISANPAYYIHKSPSMEFDSIGNLHVVWSGKKFISNNDLLYRVWNGSDWGALQIIPEMNQINRLYMKNPSIAIDSKDHISIVWDIRGATHVGIFFSHWKGTQWSPVECLSSGSDLYSPALPVAAYDSRDSLHVAWQDRSIKLTSYDVFYKTWDSESWSDFSIVNTENTGSASQFALVTRNDVANIFWVCGTQNASLEYKAICLPRDVQIGVGADGDIQHQIATISEFEQTIDISSEINEYLSKNEFQDNEIISVPISINSGDYGTLQIRNFTLTYDVLVTDPTTEYTDSDALSDGEEIFGWNATRDINGDNDTNDPNERYTIFSNPTLGDSDLDRIPDDIERFSGADPTAIDTDFDGLDDYEEMNPGEDKSVTNTSDADTDGDLHNDPVDVFPLDETEWMDTDLDGVGNTADNDDDNDGWVDSGAFGEDFDNDTIIDVFDYNADGIIDERESDPLDPNSLPHDTDGDGKPDLGEFDNDDDGRNDTFEPAYISYNLDGTSKGILFIDDDTEWLDTDGDHIGNNADPDDDNDTVPDLKDMFPLIRTEWADADKDGLGDNADPDDDNDGLTDTREATCGTNPHNPDTDGDGLTDGEEVNGWRVTIEINNDAGIQAGIDFNYTAFSNPLKEFSDNDPLPDYWEKQYGTNPRVMDSDGDGINDGDELVDAFGGGWITNSDWDGDGTPNGDTDFDSIGDSFPDGEICKAIGGTRAEVAGGYKLLEHPEDWDEDFDKDGLTNKFEYDSNYNPDKSPGAPIYWTSYLNPDSDGDGLWDGKDITFFIRYQVPITIQVSTASGSIGPVGRLIDIKVSKQCSPETYIGEDRNENGVIDLSPVHETSPLNPDCDDDWLDDGDEVMMEHQVSFTFERKDKPAIENWDISDVAGTDSWIPIYCSSSPYSMVAMDTSPTMDRSLISPSFDNRNVVNPSFSFRYKLVGSGSFQVKVKLSSGAALLNELTDTGGSWAYYTHDLSSYRDNAMAIEFLADVQSGQPGYLWTIDDFTFKGKTNPYNPDTDNDNLRDGEEIIHFWQSKATPVLKTNPITNDSDNDDMSDIYEVKCQKAGSWQNPLIFNNRFAIIISGGPENTGETEWGFFRTVRDIHNLLSEEYNYPESNIYLAYYDGTYPGYENIIDYSETTNNINEIITTVKDSITKDDFLFVWTGGHGYIAFDNINLPWAYMKLYDDSTLKSDNLKPLYTLTNTKLCHATFVYQQCHGGGFVRDGYPRATSISATSILQESMGKIIENDPYPTFSIELIRSFTPISGSVMKLDAKYPYTDEGAEFGVENDDLNHACAWNPGWPRWIDPKGMDYTTLLPETTGGNTPVPTYGADSNGNSIISIAEAFWFATNHDYGYQIGDWQYSGDAQNKWSNTKEVPFAWNIDSFKNIYL